ncbi:hypothetical protein GH714_012243 [Hevea brasiliensis]|uniref:ATP-dependent rRNA helicase SPB4-like C-terminal extension domain-containing protein n=1 Tax=Hevea brasiliensis TaxID=3981 RepID=A0A6A6KL33_HEVBR|nr:hypothetical protein GH714_012243 [Hevea brasiliensis]
MSLLNEWIESQNPNLDPMHPRLPDGLAKRAFVTYLRCIHIQKDKEVFDVMKLPIDKFSASMSPPMTPKIHFLNQKSKGKKMSGIQLDNSEKDNAKLATGAFREEYLRRQIEKLDIDDCEEADVAEEGFIPM